MAEYKEMKFQFIEPVLQIPPCRKRRHSIYDEIINEFVNSGLKCAEVKNIGRNPVTVCTTLNLRLKRKGLQNIKARLRNQKVYLEKLDTQTEIQYPKLFSKSFIEPKIQEQLQHIKPTIDVISILNTYIVKLRCPKCKSLNPRDARYCRECKYNFYTNEEEYKHAMEIIEGLERNLNSKKGENSNTENQSIETLKFHNH